MEVRQLVSVVITSTPMRKSQLSSFTPGPTNSSTLFFTSPLGKVAPTRAMATSWGPTPFRGLPSKYTMTTSGAATS